MKNDGGPAFPAKRMEELIAVKGRPGAYHEAEYPGMTLRDWFAGQALAGILSGPHAEELAKVMEQDDTARSPVVAILSYKFADAMLAEREKRDAE